MSQLARVKAADDAWQGGQVVPGALCVVAPNATQMTATGTNTWVLFKPGSGRCVIVDPGPLDVDHLDNVLSECAVRDLSPAAVICTHAHWDHFQGAPYLAILAKVPLLARDLGNLPDGPCSLGDELPDFDIISLPGHSRDSVGICCPEGGYIVVGDHVLATGATVVGPPYGRMDSYLESLRRLASVLDEGDYGICLPGHGRPFTNPGEVVHKAYERKVRRLEELRSIIESTGETDPCKLARIVYPKADSFMHPYMALHIEGEREYVMNERGLASVR